MPIINLTTLQDTLGGTEPVNATVTAYVYRGVKRAVRVSGEDVVFPAPVTVDIINGVTQDDFELLAVPADCHWKVIVWSDKNTPLRRDVILPSGSGPFNFEDLVDVNVNTSLPDAGTALATAYINEITSLTARAEQAAESIPNNIDGGTATSIYTITQTLDGGTAGNL